ncbi:MAG: hypothetical protein RLZZ158_1696 [Cyanobacteriota bacterium]
MNLAGLLLIASLQGSSCAPVQGRQTLLDPGPITVVGSEAGSAAQRPGYANQLQPSRLGWVTLPRWCIWVEPSAPDLWSQRWSQAVEAALASWAPHLRLERVERAEDAHLRLWRRRPPLQGGRASHGRALLSFQQVRRGQQPENQLEPLVEILISPGQRPQAIQATSLHELGHGFGLWGHSDQASDVMAAVPGAIPILQLSQRDLLSLGWLQGQASLFGSPWPAATPPGKSATAPPPPPGRRGD